jgi:hypothetical protein
MKEVAMFSTTCQAVVSCTNGTVIFQSDRISPDAFGATQIALAQLLRKIGDVKISQTKGKVVVTIMLTTAAVGEVQGALELKSQSLVDAAADQQQGRRDHLLMGTALCLEAIVVARPGDDGQGGKPNDL